MKTEETDVIDYESLVLGYSDSLTTVLRGFRPALGFLETWVPDEDPAKSVLNLVEVAEGAGRSQVTVFLGPDTVRNLDLPRLLRMVAALGKPDARPERGGLLLTISSLGAGQS